MSGANSATASLAKSPTVLRQVFTSPLIRASRTCALTSFGEAAEVSSDLLEWDYGRFEGKTTADIQKDRPDWELFREGCPGGESPMDVARPGPLYLSGFHL